MAFIGIDWKQHNDTDYYGLDGQYHPDNHFRGLDGKYQQPGMVYRPGVGDDGTYYYYRPENLPWKLEGPRQNQQSQWGQPGSFLGVDGERHLSGQFYGLDGRYHKADAYYDIRRGKYSDVTD